MLKTSSPHFHPFPLSTTRSVEAAKAMGVAFNSSARIFTAAGRTLFTAWVASWTSLEIGWGFEDLLYGYAIFFQVWMMQWCRDAFQPWAKSSMVSNATAAKGEVLPYGKMATCHGKSWEATATRMAKKYWVSDVHCLIAPSWANDVFVDGKFATNLRSTCQCALEHAPVTSQLRSKRFWATKLFKTTVRAKHEINCFQSQSQLRQSCFTHIALEACNQL